MSQLETFDALIIGSGQAGTPLSTALAEAGHKTGLIERQHVGGTCINEGCTPTKTMVASARSIYIAGRAPDYGVQTGLVSVDMGRVRQRKRDIVDSFRQSNRNRIESSNVELIEGQASFSGPQSVAVRLNQGGARQLGADQIFIDTGARPRLPDLPGLEDVPYLDSTSIMELSIVPEHLLIVGGGYVGLEFGQMFRRFGSRVTIVQRGEQLLSREDSDVAQAIGDILDQDGIDVRLETHPTQVERTNEGLLRLQLEDPEGELSIVGSHLLVAAGRVPNTESLNLEAAGVETDDRGYIQVNARLETNVPGIYALGDVKGGPAFTHISYDDFRVIRSNLLENGAASIEGRLVPYTVFIDPQLGRVGLSEKQARQQGVAVRVARLPLAHVARAIETGETRGFMKALVDAESDQILGCAILGVQGGEIMAMMQLAMMGRLPYTALRDGVFAHPTLAESLNNLFMSLEMEKEPR